MPWSRRANVVTGRRGGGRGAGRGTVAIPAAPVIAVPGGVVTGQTITWSAVPGASSYALYRNGALIGTITSPYTILAADLNKVLDVRAVNAGGTSPASNTVGSLDASANGTFGRTGEGSQLNSAPTDGSVAFLSWIAANARRFDTRGDGIATSLLMEKSATNYQGQSRALETTAGGYWTASASASHSADANAGPDGSVTATRVLASTTSLLSNYGLAPGPAGQVVASMWARARTGTQVSQFLVWGASGTAITAVRQTLTTTFARVKATRVAVTSSGDLPFDGRDRSADGGGAAVTTDLYVDLHQLEAGPYATSVIRTTAGTGTRGADTLSYATGAYPDTFRTTGVVVVFAPDASSAEIVTANEDWRLVQIGANDYLRIRKSGANCVVDLVCGGVVVATSGAITFPAYQQLTITAKPSAGSLVVAGASTGNGTYTGTGAAWAAASTLYVGGDNAGANNVTGRFVGSSIQQAA